MECQVNQRSRACVPTDCFEPATTSGGSADPDEVRLMLSELKGTPLGRGSGFDEEVRTRLRDFQRSEGLKATGEPDTLTLDRLRMRFEHTVAARETIGPNPAPSEAQHAEVVHVLQKALHEVETLAHQFAHDAPIRAAYVKEAKESAAQILRAFERGELTAGQAAFSASTLRNNALLEARGGLSSAGQALSRFLKEEGLELPALVSKYSNKMFGRPFAALSSAERSEVCLQIAKKAGVTNPKVNAAAAHAPHASKALLAVSIAVAFYQVSQADDKVGETIKQGAGFVGFWAGAKAGTAIGTTVSPACGPAAPACVLVGTLAGGLLGAIAAEEIAEAGYHRIQG